MTCVAFTVVGTRSVTVIAVDTGIFTSYNKYRYTCKNREKSVSFAFLQSVLKKFRHNISKEKYNIRQREKKKTKETMLDMLRIYRIFFFLKNKKQK